MKRIRYLVGVLAAFGGACAEPCTLDMDCSPGNACVDGRCERAGGVGDGGSTASRQPSTGTDSQTGTDTAVADGGGLHGPGGIISGGSDADTDSETDTSHSAYFGRCDMVNFCVEYTEPLWTPQLVVEECDAVLGYYDATERCDRGPNCTGMCEVPGEFPITMFYHTDGPTDPSFCYTLDSEFSASCD